MRKKHWLALSLAVTLLLVGCQKTETPTFAEEPKTELVALETSVEPAQMLSEYQNINQDVVGILKVEGTRIRYPILQGKDNDYYLNHTIDGKRTTAASVFMDYTNKADYSDLNTVLYGHNMNNGSMFHELILYREQAHLDKYGIMTVTTQDKVITYQIFSVYPTEPEYDYRTPNYTSKQLAQSFLDRIAARSIVQKEVELTPESQVLTLSTCVYDFDDARLAVHGVKIKEEAIPAGTPPVPVAKAAA